MCHMSNVKFQVSHIRCHLSGVMCQVSGVRCQVSCVMCQVSGVTCQVLFGGAIRWRVCYQWGLSRLVSCVGCLAAPHQAPGNRWTIWQLNLPLFRCWLNLAWLINTFVAFCGTKIKKNTYVLTLGSCGRDIEFPWDVAADRRQEHHLWPSKDLEGDYWDPLTKRHFKTSLLTNIWSVGVYPYPNKVLSLNLGKPVLSI